MQKWLFLSAVLALPFMRPAVRYPLIFADLFFLLAGAATLFSLLVGARKLRWRPAYWVLVASAVGLAPSIMVSPDPPASLFKMMTILYLLGLTILTDQLIDTAEDLRATILVWIGAATIVAIAGVAALVTLPFSPGSWLVRWASNEFGTLPSGAYVRLRLTFFMASMMCNYMTVAAGLLILARTKGWIGHLPFLLFLCVIAVAGLMSLSPGIGGIVLVLGAAYWLHKRADRPKSAWLILGAATTGAALMVVAMSFTFIPHDTAPFVIHLTDSTAVYPAVRFLTWSAAMAEWMRHPWIGHGIGMDSVSVFYRDPLGGLREMTDAHNIFLSIASQSGLVGLSGLIAVVALACRLAFKRGFASGPALLPLGLGLIFLNAFVYQGLGGSFEDSRHLWVLLGLLLAAERLHREDKGGVGAHQARARG